MSIPKILTQYYQGDVGLIKVDKLPAKAIKQPKPEKLLVLEYGETSGHAHGIAEIEKCDLYLEGTKRFLEICFQLPLIHTDVLKEGAKGDHDPIVLEPGIYEVRRQREWSVLKQISRLQED